jgi:hypothetical protein
LPVSTSVKAARSPPTIFAPLSITWPPGTIVAATQFASPSATQRGCAARLPYVPAQRS